MRIEIAVEGMQCENCERAVATALECLEGVRRADADHEAKQVRVRFDPGQVSAELLRAQITEAGFKPR